MSPKDSPNIRQDPGSRGRQVSTCLPNHMEHLSSFLGGGEHGFNVDADWDKQSLGGGSHDPGGRDADSGDWSAFFVLLVFVSVSICVF
jgi:hypothetical protein